MLQKTDMDRFMYLDIETDGIGSFRPPTQKIVQLGYVLGDKRVSIFNKEVNAVNPQVPHPYDPEYLSEHGVSLEEMMRTFLNDLRTCEYVVAHNAAFDLGCIKAELTRRRQSRATAEDSEKTTTTYDEVFAELLKKTIVDTMILSTPICKLKGKYGFKWPTLEELHVYCFDEKPKEALHDAVNDCLVTKRSLEFLVQSGKVPLVL